MAAMNTELHCASALLPEGWQTDVRLTVDAEGTITTVEPGCARAVGPTTHRLNGPVVPGMPNLHSHAFQRAIAGCTQRRGPTSDSFWTWREAMYASVDRIGPSELEAIAAGLFVELLEGGFTSVAEFHYLHHQQSGVPYADPDELSLRMVAAAQATGIGLTLLPTLYMTGGLDGRALGPRQLRFAHTPDTLLHSIARLQQLLSADSCRDVGLGLHSLRAVPPHALRDVLDGMQSVRADAPIHIHIAEQSAEVEACLSLRGARPVAWLLDHVPVDARWCLVHATHIDPSELAGMRRADVVAGLCPTTEADLGDGVFPAEAWVASGGGLGVGTDSHVGRSAPDELRWLEYGQRLIHQRRNVLQWPGQPHTGAAAWRAAVQGGAQALGRVAGQLAVGHRADLVLLRDDAPGVQGLEGDALLDAWIFGGAGALVDSVVVGGRLCVENGQHRARGPIMDRFAAVLRQLRR